MTTQRKRNYTLHQWWSRVLNFQVRVLILKNVLEYEYRKNVRVRVLLQKLAKEQFLSCNSSKFVAKT